MENVDKSVFWINIGEKRAKLSTLFIVLFMERVWKMWICGNCGKHKDKRGTFPYSYPQRFFRIYAGLEWFSTVSTPPTTTATIL